MTQQEFDEFIKSGRFRIIENRYDGCVVEDTRLKKQISFSNTSPIIPLIMDPGNPFNNVYKSGISNYSPRDSEGTYRVGTGNWTNLAAWIHKFDISIPVEKNY